MNKRIYIAGPMTGLPNYNFDIFNATEESLRKLYPDAAIINPARQFNGNQDLPREAYIAGAVDMVKVCDTIYFLPGWWCSDGAIMEMVVGYNLGHRMLFSPGYAPHEDLLIDDEDYSECNGYYSREEYVALACRLLGEVDKKKKTFIREETGTLIWEYSDNPPYTQGDIAITYRFDDNYNVLVYPTSKEMVVPLTGHLIRVRIKSPLVVEFGLKDGVTLPMGHEVRATEVLCV